MQDDSDEEGDGDDEEGGDGDGSSDDAEVRGVLRVVSQGLTLHTALHTLHTKAVLQHST